jgi:hypothetical protein
MNRGAMRTLLRRRLLEPVSDQWDDSTLNELLNLALALVRKQVRKVDYEFDIRWEYRDTIAGTNWYEKPNGTRGSIEIGVKKAASDTDWTALKRAAYHVARTYTAESEMVYCHRGAYIGLFPAPSVSIADGIQFLHAPTETLALDTDIPRLEESLQYAVVCWASLLAKGESPESDDKDAKELARLLGDIPADYGSLDLSQPTYLQADVADARGMFGRRVANDIDIGRNPL